MAILSRKSIGGNSVFEVAKTVDMPVVVGHFADIPLRKQGRAWVGLCPFHPDRRPSLVVRPGNYRCFGCGVRGDQVDFVARLLNLRPIEAARRICREFGLEAADEAAPGVRRETLLLRALSEWEARTHRGLATIYRACHQVLQKGPDKELEDPAFTAACHLEPVIEHWLDALYHGEPEDAVELYRQLGWGWAYRG